MRQIKFRAWDRVHAKMVDVLAIGFRSNEVVTAESALTIGEHCDLLQFTGIIDVTANEIYEGDIVRDRFGRIMQVKFWNYRLCWVAISETNFHHADLYDWVDYDYNTDGPDGIARVKVIGNIYEHAHLLNSTPNPEGSDTTDGASSTTA